MRVVVLAGALGLALGAGLASAEPGDATTRLLEIGQLGPVVIQAGLGSYGFRSWRRGVPAVEQVARLVYGRVGQRAELEHLGLAQGLAVDQ